MRELASLLAAEAAQARALLLEHVVAYHDWLDAWGLLAIFLVSFGECAFFSGVFVPGFAVLIAAGFLTGAALMSPLEVFLTAFAGAFLGDQIGFLVGRYLPRLLDPRRSASLYRAGRALSQDGWLLLTYHFTPWLRPLGPLAAGLLRFPPLRWWWLDSLGLAIWILCCLGVGAQLGRQGSPSDGPASGGPDLAALALACAPLVIFAAISYRAYSSVAAAKRPRFPQATIDEPEPAASPARPAPYDPSC